VEDVIISIGKFEVIISACDVEKIRAHSWHKTGNPKSGGPYFSYTTSRPEHKEIRLHRFIVDCPPEFHVDHINGNTLDNRRSNLRICTQEENKRNRRKSSNSSSGYKGVFWDNHYKKWGSSIQVNHKRIYLGRFDNPEKAYEAYVAASKKYHGEFGRIA
jgi:hypothetical protein